MKKAVVIFILSLAVPFLLAAQTATLQNLNGKVEVQKPGMSWESASEGMELSKDSRISTGFASEATLVMDNANIKVSPLTRMTLAELTTQGQTTTTRLYLGSGRIRTDVKKSEGRINDFQVRSPVATAAVRGTSFIFDGINLSVSEGRVAFSTTRGGSVSVPKGSSSQADPSGQELTPPADQKREETSVSPTTDTGETPADDGGGAEDETLESARTAGTGLPETSATLTIILQ